MQTQKPVKTISSLDGIKRLLLTYYWVASSQPIFVSGGKNEGDDLEKKNGFLRFKIDSLCFAIWALHILQLRTESL